MPPQGNPSFAGRQWWTDQPAWHYAPCGAPGGMRIRGLCKTGKVKIKMSIKLRLEMGNPHHPCSEVNTVYSNNWFKDSPHHICGWPRPAWSGTLWGRWWGRVACTPCPDSKHCFLSHGSHRWAGPESGWCHDHYNETQVKIHIKPHFKENTPTPAGCFCGCKTFQSDVAAFPD